MKTSIEEKRRCKTRTIVRFDYSITRIYFLFHLLNTVRLCIIKNTNSHFRNCLVSLLFLRSLKSL